MRPLLLLFPASSTPPVALLLVVESTAFEDATAAAFKLATAFLKTGKLVSTPNLYAR
jgi:hypothetical protein